LGVVDRLRADVATVDFHVQSLCRRTPSQSDWRIAAAGRQVEYTKRRIIHSLQPCQSFDRRPENGSNPAQDIDPTQPLKSSNMFGRLQSWLVHQFRTAAPLHPEGQIWQSSHFDASIALSTLSQEDSMPSRNYRAY
jgi:hypothetical protein